MSAFMRSKAARWGLLVAAIIAAGAAVAVATFSSSRHDKMANVSLSPVLRGPLTISVAEPGTIKAKQQEVIKSELEGSATILYLIPEGTIVKKGTLLVELDVSKLQDQKVTQQITVQNAEASYIAAQENLEVARSQAASDVMKAEQDYEFAKKDLVKYMEGDFPTEENKAKVSVTLAESELERLKQVAEWSEKLYAEKYISSQELLKDKLARDRAVLDLQVAQGNLKLLKEYTYERRVRELQGMIRQTEMALDRTKRKATADVNQADVAARTKKLEYERQKSLLDKTETMISKAKIYSPVDGLVVYASTGGGREYRFSQEPLQEGSNVRERQELIYLPTANSVIAEIKARESSLDKIRPGLPVRVTVDALPDRVLNGTVTKIAPLPDAGSFWQNPDLKVFNTEIQIQSDDPDLRTGMNCRAEIIVDYYPDALYIPMQSVVRVNGKPTVYLPGKDGPVPRTIEVGLDNNRMIRVISGLQAGEMVLLNPPLAEAAAPVESENGTPPVIPPPATRPALGAPRVNGGGMNGTIPGGGDVRPAGGEGRRGQPGEGGGPGGQAGQGGRGGMTAEQREEMRKRFESMTPEEREKALQEMRQRRGGGQGGRGGEGGGPGGAGGGFGVAPGGASGGPSASPQRP